MEQKIIYPIGIQDFEKLREYGFEYVDKTEYIRKLIENPKYYFLSRPRRFGKSLFLSTLKAYFEGKRESFKGLALDSDDVDWTARPVLLFSFNTLNPKTPQSLDDYFHYFLSCFEEIYGESTKGTAVPQRFERLLINAHEKSGQKCVVLIDEYDSPLLSTLEKPELNTSYRETLKSFFSVLKSSDAHIHFAFITGVSRFSHTSLFSGANNITDISMDDEYSAACGITEAELRSHLMPGVSQFAREQDVSDDDALAILKENYDGYHFSRRSQDIYNPFSLFNALEKKEIGDYWFQSGTPTYLLNVMKKDNFYIPDLDGMEVPASSLSVKESYLNNPVALLFETGYLTIRQYDPETGDYFLRCPNKEVSVSLSQALLPVYSGLSEFEAGNLTVRLRKAVVRGNPDEMMELLKVLLAGNPYSNTELAKREAYFRNNLYLALKSLGFQVEAEKQTSNARMDLFMKTRRFIYIFELKVDGTPDEAIAQIDDRKYAFPFSCDNRQIIKIGASYSSAENNIGSWTISR